jgi:type IV secretion system protein VirD4
MKTALKVLFVIIGLVLCSVAVTWGAGFLFVVFNKSIQFRATNVYTWYEYWQQYQNDPIVSKLLLKSLAGSAAIVFGLIIVVAVAAVRDRRSLHGDARFANSSEIANTGLTKEKQGIIVGRRKGQYLIYGGEQFVLMAAPTRSGKGVGIVIPNLLNYSESVVVLDTKQENYKKTAGFRKKWGQDIYLFNPFADDLRSHRYNPLFYIGKGHFRIADIQSIASVLYPGEGRDTFFDDQAANLFLGIVLYLCETPHLPRTIGEALRQSSGKGKPPREYIQGIINSRNFIEHKERDGKKGKVTLLPKTEWKPDELPPLSMECVDALNRFCNTSDNTMTSILASFNAPLGIWANPVVDAATSGNDFDLRDVRRRKMTIYVGVKPRYLKESRRLLNLFFSQLIHLNTDELPEDNESLKYQCLLLLDEFTSIGRLAILEVAVSYIAGYNLRLLPIIQSTSQLTAVYKDYARNFITNFAMRILFPPSDDQDAKEYSEMLGYETVKGRSRSRNVGAKTSRGETESDQRRALLLPQELKGMGEDAEIISLEHTKPIRCKKICYYKEDAFKDRVLPEPRAPVLDLMGHKAKVEARIRPVTENDVKDGIDLDKLTADFSSLTNNDKEGLSPEEDVENFVTNFFDALEFVDETEDKEENQSNEELVGYSEYETDEQTDSEVSETTDEIINSSAMVIDLSVLESPITVHKG